MAQPGPKSRCVLLVLFVEAVIVIVTAPLISLSSTANGVVAYVNNLHRGDTVVWVWMLCCQKQHFFAADVLYEPLGM